MQLWEWQKKAIRAWVALGGLFAGQPTGAGKTMAIAMICKLELDQGGRPLIVAPKSATEQIASMLRSLGVPARALTSKNRRAEELWGKFISLASHRNLRTPSTEVAVVGFEVLNRSDWADFFEEFCPTVVCLDEAHKFRNVRTCSGAARFDKYVRANPGVRVCVSTASPREGSIKDFAHLMEWALRQHNPLPRSPRTLHLLSERLAGDTPRARRARQAFFNKHLQNKPGVFLDDAESYPGTIRLWREYHDPIATLGPGDKMPSGDYCISPAQAATVSTQLAWGFYTRRYPEPPRELREAEREWGAIVRNAGPEFTDSQVRAQAPAQWARLEELTAKYGPFSTRVQWLLGGKDRLRAKVVSELGLDNPHVPTLIWARSTVLQEALGDILGCPVFREGGRCGRTGRIIYEDRQSPVAVASASACGQSFNAQHHFGANVVLQPGASHTWWRQMIGRTARYGQRFDEVPFLIVLACEADERRLQSALTRAREALEETGQRNPLLSLDEDF